MDNVKLRYSLSKQGEACIRVVNIFGQTVAVILKNEMKEAGDYESLLDAKALSPGVYFCIIESADFKELKKLVKIGNQ